MAHGDYNLAMGKVGRTENVPRVPYPGSARARSGRKVGGENLPAERRYRSWTDWTADLLPEMSALPGVIGWSGRCLLRGQYFAAGRGQPKSRWLAIRSI